MMKCTPASVQARLIRLMPALLSAQNKLGHPVLSSNAKPSALYFFGSALTKQFKVSRPFAGSPESKPGLLMQALWGMSPE